jgi:hypothetical protein
MMNWRNYHRICSNSFGLLTFFDDEGPGPLSPHGGREHDTPKASSNPTPPPGRGLPGYRQDSAFRHCYSGLCGRADRLGLALRNAAPDRLRGRNLLDTGATAGLSPAIGCDGCDRGGSFGERPFELVKHDREQDEAADERALPKRVDS